MVYFEKLAKIKIMTLAKTKPKRPSLDHRRRHGHHHRHSHDYVKTYWPYLPIIAILAVGLLTSGWLGRANKTVLGYATDMSVASLLSDTNQQRAGNSEGALVLNSQLNQAAQAKADDMAARDYWSHDTPDGKTPWTFMTAAGYNYQTAGENLAYGFATAADTLTGWMNSPEHRANILNTSYRDVGFGIINIADYQGTGPETLVVAMYGSQPGGAATPSAPTASTPAQETKQTPVPVPAPTPEPAASPVATSQPATSKPTATTQNQDTVEPASQHVTQLELVSSNTPLNTLAVITLGISAGVFLVLRHSWAWRKMLVKGEKFVLHHPMLDISAMVVVSAVLALSHTAGLIR